MYAFLAPSGTRQSASHLEHQTFNMSGLLAKFGDVMSTLVVFTNECIEQMADWTGMAEKHITVSIAVIAGVWLSWKLLLSRPSNLPPGPRPLPLIGTMHSK